MSAVHMSQSQTRIYYEGPEADTQTVVAEVTSRAEELANQTGHRAEVYTSDGVLIYSVPPARRTGQP